MPLSEKLNLHSYSLRKFKNKFFYVLCLICLIIAIVPLLSILFEVIVRGAPAINWQFLTGNGLRNNIGPAIQGTLILIGLTSAIGIPIGILTGVYLAEYGNNKYATWIRTINDILTGFPSIIVGITAYSLIVVGLTGTFSPMAGAVALAFIMIPIVARTTEESLKLVPNSVREASMALGIHRWRTTLSVMLPSAKGGLITGIVLAIARIAGETAPILLTILGNFYFFQGLNAPIDALPLRIYLSSRSHLQIEQTQAWGAALVLILIVLTLNICVRLASRGRNKGTR
ncbi:phosphate ABC transporter permease PstA [Candidatus Bathycorpusculum sp.]|uniref:phosphate ABC transporter permease PstA n=1 Tax=Candidatus Bathycorpusculum sp. TaxID=2994959 RepID=UPI0028308AFD|nr:phosphate ABC transporter permease PstA [Candidatus Termitimicrobium sp.]MCL2685761.1 phosphate ABC transporter permease PstA [Candidatus Termitimicrobium sp.]